MGPREASFPHLFPCLGEGRGLGGGARREGGRHQYAAPGHRRMADGDQGRDFRTGDPGRRDPGPVVQGWSPCPGAANPDSHRGRLARGRFPRGSFRGRGQYIPRLSAAISQGDPDQRQRVIGLCPGVGCEESPDVCRGPAAVGVQIFDPCAQGFQAGQPVHLPAGTERKIHNLWRAGRRGARHAGIPGVVFQDCHCGQPLGR